MSKLAVRISTITASIAVASSNSSITHVNNEASGELTSATTTVVVHANGRSQAYSGAKLRKEIETRTGIPVVDARVILGSDSDVMIVSDDGQISEVMDFSYIDSCCINGRGITTNGTN